MPSDSLECLKRGPLDFLKAADQLISHFAINLEVGPAKWSQPSNVLKMAISK